MSARAIGFVVLLAAAALVLAWSLARDPSRDGIEPSAQSTPVERLASETSADAGAGEVAPIAVAPGAHERAAVPPAAAPVALVEGTLVDDEGAPVAGARCDVAGQSFRSGADGRFALEVPPGEVELSIEAEGVAPLRARVVAPCDLGTLVLHRRRTLVVQVVDHEQAPIEGAQVTATSLLRYETFDSQSTDSAGRAALGLPLREAARVHAFADGHATRGANVAPRETHVTLELARTTVLKGRVVDVESRPIEGAILTYAYTSATSAADGSFAIATPSATSRYMLAAQAPGYERTTVMPELGSPPPDVTVVLRRSASMVGRVPAGVAVTSITCALDARADWRPWQRDASLDGTSFVVDELPPGSGLRLEITLASGRVTLPVAPLAPGERRDVGELALPALGRFAVQLVAPPRFLRDVELEYYWLPAAELRATVLDEAVAIERDLVDTSRPLELGAFTDGTIRIQLQSAGFDAFDREFETSGERDQVVALELRPELRVEGVLRGAPECVDGATLSLLHRASGRGSAGLVAADGSFAIGHVRTGVHDGYVYGPGPESCVYSTVAAFARDLDLAHGMGPLLLELPASERVVTGRLDGVERIPAELFAQLEVVGVGEDRIIYDAELAPDGTFRIVLGAFDLEKIYLGAIHFGVALGNPWLSGCSIEGRFTAGDDVTIPVLR